MVNWRDELTGLLRELRAQEFDYPIGAQEIRSAQSKKRTLPAALTPLYEITDGVNRSGRIDEVPNVHIGKAPGLGCSFCHIVKEYATRDEAEAALDLKHFNQVAVGLRLTRDVVEFVAGGVIFKSASLAGPTEAAAAAQAPGGLSIPSVAGGRVSIPGRLSTEQLAELQAKEGVEFAQIYVAGPGKGGGGGQYFLIRGSAGNVTVPLGPNVRFINHSHPATLSGASVPLRASSADQNVLRLLQRAGSPQRTSQVVPEVGEPFLFDVLKTRK